MTSSARTNTEGGTSAAERRTKAWLNPTALKAYYDGAVTVCGRHRAASTTGTTSTATQCSTTGTLPAVHAVKKSEGADRGGRTPKKTGTCADPDPGVPLCPRLVCMLAISGKLCLPCKSVYYSTASVVLSLRSVISCKIKLNSRLVAIPF